MDEEDDSGLLWAGATENVEDMQKDLKSSSLLSYMLKTSRLLTQGFDNNRTAQEKLFKNMCILGAWSDWREKIRVVSSYLDVESTKDQFRILNPTPLDCNTGYIIEDTVGDRAFERLPLIMLNFFMVLFQVTVLFLTHQKNLNR